MKMKITKRMAAMAFALTVFTAAGGNTVCVSAQEIPADASQGRIELSDEICADVDLTIYSEPNTSSYQVAVIPAGVYLERTAILPNGWSEVRFASMGVATDRCYVRTQQATGTVTADDLANAKSAVASNTTKTVAGQIYYPVETTPGGIHLYSEKPSTNAVWPDYISKGIDAAGITADMSDYDRCVALNSYICSVLTYDYDTYNKDASGNAWMVGMTPQEIALTPEWKSSNEQCLVTGKAVCEGYANAFHSMCRALGIECYVVTGGVASADPVPDSLKVTVNGTDYASHAWNKVVINGQNYYVDTCWNDTSENQYLMHTSPFAGRYSAND